MQKWEFTFLYRKLRRLSSLHSSLGFTCGHFDSPGVDSAGSGAIADAQLDKKGGRCRPNGGALPRGLSGAPGSVRGNWPPNSSTDPCAHSLSAGQAQRQSAGGLMWPPVLSWRSAADPPAPVPCSRKPPPATAPRSGGGRLIVQLPRRIESWSFTSLQQRLVKTGGRLVKHSRYYSLLLAESHLTPAAVRVDAPADLGVPSS
jgi:hypothetical protein